MRLALHGLRLLLAAALLLQLLQQALALRYLSADAWAISAQLLPALLIKLLLIGFNLGLFCWLHRKLAR